jgi:hypothetical protein
MRLVLDELAAGVHGRQQMIDYLYELRRRPGVLGPYGFTNAGDTTLCTCNAYRIADGRLVWASRARP